MTHTESYVLEIRPKDAPTNAAVAFVLVHREDEEISAHGGGLASASIKLTCEAFAMPGQPNPYQPKGVFHFWGGYSAVANTVSLTSTSVGSSGGVFVDPEALRGHRVAGYLMNEIVLWARQWPNANVMPVSLSANQATPGNHERRNAFWQSFGLTFSQPDMIEGYSNPMLVSQLTTVSSWTHNITKHRLANFLANQFAQQSLTQMRLNSQVSRNKELRDELKKSCSARWWPFRRK